MSEEFNTTYTTSADVTYTNCSGNEVTYTTSRVDQDCRCCRSGSGDTTTNMLKVVWGNDVNISIQLSKKVGDSYEEYDLSDGEDYKLNIVNKYGDRIEFPIFIADNKIKFILDSQELESNVPYSIEVLWQEGPYDKRVFGRDMFMYVNSSIDATPSDTSITPQTDYEYNIVMEGDVCYISIGQIPEVDLSNYVTQGELTTQINQLWLDVSDQFVDNDELAYVIDNLPLPDMSSYVSKDELNHMSYVDHTYLDSNYPSKTYLDSNYPSKTYLDSNYPSKTYLDSYYPSYTYLYSYVGDAISNIDVDIDLSSYGKTLSRYVDRFYGADFTQAVVLNGPNGEISRVLLADNAAWKDGNGDWKTRLLYSGLLRRQDLIEFKQNTERITAIENSLPSYITQDELSANAYVTQTALDSMTYIDQATLSANSYVSQSSLDAMSYVSSSELDTTLVNASYVTQVSLSSNSYVTNDSLSNILDNASYIDQVTLSANSYATESYVADAIAGVTIDESNLVHKTGNEIIFGNKTFSSGTGFINRDYNLYIPNMLNPGVKTAMDVSRAQINQACIGQIITPRITTNQYNYQIEKDTILFQKVTGAANNHPSLSTIAKIDSYGNIYEGTTKISEKYVSYAYLDDVISNLPLPDLSSYVTRSEMDATLATYVTYIDWDNTNEAIAQELTDNRLAHLDINSQFSYYYTKTDSDSRYATQSWVNNKFVTQADDVNRQQAIAAAFASSVQSTYVHNIWQGTQSDYNNILTPDPNTLYVII